jgi:hypothetical protein
MVHVCVILAIISIHRLSVAYLVITLVIHVPIPWPVPLANRIGRLLQHTAHAIPDFSIIRLPTPAVSAPIPASPAQRHRLIALLAITQGRSAQPRLLACVSAPLMIQA